MTSRFRLAWIVGSLALAGCDAQYAGPIPYRDGPRMAKDLADKPKLQAAIRNSLLDLYGNDVRHIKVPEDSGLREGGIYLADHVRVGDKLEPVLERDPATGRTAPIEGGYALYRKHCLHCHGVFGAGDGPTAAFLYPRPRDYRPGIFKFTSTNPVNAKPTRADLRKTLLYGLHGTSMPGFEAIMTPSEIEQVIDYMTFLSIRGETEKLPDRRGDQLRRQGRRHRPWPRTSSRRSSQGRPRPGRTPRPRSSTRRPAGSRSTPRASAEGATFSSAPTRRPEARMRRLPRRLGQGQRRGFIEPEIFRDVVFRQWPLDQAIDRFYRAEKVKAKADRTTPRGKPDPEGVAKFSRTTRRSSPDSGKIAA